MPGLLVLCSLFWLRKLTDGDGNSVAGVLVDLAEDVFPDADDIADRAVPVLHTHIDQAPNIGDAIKGCSYPDPSCSKFLFDIIRKTDKRSVLPRGRFNHCKKFVNMMIHYESLSF